MTAIYLSIVQGVHFMHGYSKVESVDNVFAQRKLGSREHCTRAHWPAAPDQPGACVSRNLDALGGNKESIGKPVRETSNRIASRNRTCPSQQVRNVSKAVAALYQQSMARCGLVERVPAQCCGNVYLTDPSRA